MKSLWLLQALTCSRHEDGVSCRHGVKPPLTHSLFKSMVIDVTERRLGSQNTTWTHKEDARYTIILTCHKEVFRSHEPSCHVEILGRCVRPHLQQLSLSFSTLSDISFHHVSAESVAISLLKRFSEKQLPKASELEWLVSEQEAPQAVSIAASCVRLSYWSEYYQWSQIQPITVYILYSILWCRVVRVSMRDGSAPARSLRFLPPETVEKTRPSAMAVRTSMTAQAQNRISRKPCQHPTTG